jgi:electron transport complex protein RnfG
MAAKKESTFINMVVVLFLVSAIAATALAFVYQATKGPIAKAKLEKIIEPSSNL